VWQRERICVYVSTCVNAYSICVCDISHFPQKSPIISGSFAKRDLELKASYASPPCTYVSLICTGWRRCIGCLKLQVSFRKRATKRRAFWREMTYWDEASCRSSAPVWHDSCRSSGRCTWQAHQVAWLIHMCDVTPRVCVTRTERRGKLVALVLQVSFRKIASTHWSHSRVVTETHCNILQQTAYIYIYTHVCIYVYMYIHTHTYVYIYMYHKDNGDESTSSHIWLRHQRRSTYISVIIYR